MKAFFKKIILKIKGFFVKIGSSIKGLFVKIFKKKEVAK